MKYERPITWTGEPVLEVTCDHGKIKMAVPGSMMEQQKAVAEDSAIPYGGTGGREPIRNHLPGQLILN